MRTVAFARLTPDLRTYKMAKALKKVGGYRTVFLCQQRDALVPSDAFDEIVEFQRTALLAGNSLVERQLKYMLSAVRSFTKRMFGTSSLELAVTEQAKRMTEWKPLIERVRALEEGADLFHAVTEPNVVPEMVMRHTAKPVVYDVYDFSGVRFGAEALTGAERERERYCLEHASGISMKFPPSILDYYRNLGTKITCPVLTFIDYCLPEFFSWKDKALDLANIHVAYAGIVNPSSDDPLIAGNNQYFDIIKSIINQKIHFHLYVSPMVLRSRELFKDYYELAEQNPHFIMHESKGQPELQQELSQYDFGVILNDFSKTKITKLFEETSFGNKYSTYLEAGLPIIINENLKLNTEYVEKYGVGFSVNLSQLSELSSFIARQDYQIFKNNVKISREGPLNIYNNISKLTEFYDSLV